MNISIEKFSFKSKQGDIRSSDMPSPGSFDSKALDASLNGVYVYDLKLRKHVYANRRCTYLTGYTLEDLNRFDSSGFYELFHPEDRQRVIEHMARISGGEDMLQCEYRFKTKDGRWMWCLSRETVFDRDPGGSVVKIIGTFLDVTDRKRVEEELRESQARLSWVLERTEIGTWLNELPFDRLNWDETTKRLFFVPPDEEPSIDLFWSRIHPDDREATRTAVEKALREGALYTIDHRAVNPDTGEIRWIRSMGQASYAENETPTRFDGINFDITERKNTEDALRESEQNQSRQRRFLETLLDSSQACIGVIEGEELRYKMANRAYRALRPEIQMIGRTVREVFPDAAEAGTEALLQNVLETGRSSQAHGYRAPVPGRPDAAWDHQIVRLPNAAGEKPSLLIVTWDVTEHKRAQEALAASEKNYRELVETANSIILRLDSRGVIRFVNDYGLQFFGYSAEELTGRDVIVLVPEIEEGSGRNLHSRVKNVIANPLNYKNMTNENVTRDGRSVWVSWTNKAVTDERGNLREILSVGNDITAMKNAEEALRESRTLFQNTFENAAVGIIHVSPDGRLVRVNRKMSDIVGFSKEELSVKTFQEITHPDDLQRDLELAKQLVEGKIESYELEKRYIKKDGSIVWVRLTAAMQSKDLGVGVVQDISEQKNAEKALRESEERFRQLADAMPQLVWTAKPDGTVDYFNKRHKEYAERDRGSNGARRWRPVLHEEDESPTKEAWRRAVLIGEKYQIEHRIRLLDGGCHWHLTRAIPVRDKVGAIAKWFGTSTDIDNVKQIEESLRELTASQERKIAERTRLAEDRAKKLQVLAVEMIEAEERERNRISELLHEDLQQMLAAALLQLQSEWKNGPSPPSRQNAERLIKESIAKSSGLSHELSPPMLRHLDLTAALKWLSRHMRERFGMEVEVATSAEPRLKADSMMSFLFRAARELLFNVYKHAEAKSARLELSGRRDRVVLSVSDGGKGFDPSILRSGAAKDRLGLLSIRERARYLGGDLEIESAPGRGSRLTLAFPLEVAGAEESVRSAPESERNRSGPGRLKDLEGAASIRVLFVDDHKVIRQGLVKLIGGHPEIESAGEAADGREAVEQALLLEPDVILMDVSMPGMDGIEATRRIKEKMPGVRVIGLSMHEDEKIAAEMRKAGAEVFLSKTASPAELLNAVYGSKG